MIKNKIFESEELLNTFNKENNVKIISIETQKVEHARLPIPGGERHIVYRDVLKVWYDEIDN